MKIFIISGPVFNKTTNHTNIHMHDKVTKKQRTNGPVNAHLISGPRISTQYTNPK